MSPAETEHLNMIEAAVVAMEWRDQWINRARSCREASVTDAELARRALDAGVRAREAFIDAQIGRHKS